MNGVEVKGSDIINVLLSLNPNTKDPFLYYLSINLMITYARQLYMTGVTIIVSRY
jgi:hypothetical protein